MASETERLDASINHNLKNVYIKLRKEETDVILDRLIQEPYDISNLEELNQNNNPKDNKNPINYTKNDFSRFSA